MKARTAYATPPRDMHSGGGFRCIDAVGQGPLLNCGRDEGVRWDTADNIPGKQTLWIQGVGCAEATANFPR